MKTTVAKAMAVKLISMVLVFIFLASIPLSATERGPKGDTSPLNESGSESKRASLSTGYHLQAGDTLQIDIRNPPSPSGYGGRATDLNTKQEITSDGTISLPMVGRLKVQGLSLDELDATLKTEFAKYVQSPMIVTYLIPRTPKPIYIIQHNLSANTWQTHKAETVEEARALAGPSFSPTANIEPGQVIYVEMGRKPEWFEKNWYKVITATILVTGFVVSRR